jgi:hypothetical protein
MRKRATSMQLAWGDSSCVKVISLVPPRCTTFSAECSECRRCRYSAPATVDDQRVRHSQANMTTIFETPRMLAYYVVPVLLIYVSKLKLGRHLG